jgi:hypothetical protein
MDAIPPPIDVDAIPKITAPNLPVTRDGVTSVTLAANGIYQPDETELELKWGYKKGPGFIIPYFDRNGVLIIDGKIPFGRLRRDDTFLKEEEKKYGVKPAKYLQRPYTEPHLYIPRGFDINYTDSLVIVEGEIKALSLVEAGIPALGIGGFYSFQNKGSLLPETEDLLKSLRPKRLFFLGDGDTSHNWQFSDGAVKMVVMATPLWSPPPWVLLPRIPIDSAKGIDDIRHELGPKFPAFWQSIVDTAVLISPQTDRNRLCLFLLEREIKEIATLPPDKRADLVRRFAKIEGYMGAARACLQNALNRSEVVLRS